MRRVVFVACLLFLPALTLAGDATGVNYGRGPRYDTTFWNWPSGLGLRWMGAVENQLAVNTGLGTGKIFYVDSDVSVAGDGSNWANAKATLAGAIALCTANRGDIIYVAQGHAENIASAAAIDVNKAGIRIIGCGQGDDMPEFSLTAAASTFQISAADVTIQHIRFLGNYTNGVTECVDITATGDGARILDCEFKETSNAKELLKMITVTADADRVVIVGNRFLGEAGGSDSIAINLEGGSDKLLLCGNAFIGDWSGYVIDGTTAASTEIEVAGNYIHNCDTTAGKTMAFHASATGGVFANECYGNGTSYAFVGDALYVSPSNAFLTVENVETTVTYYDLLTTIDDYLDTEIAAILADTGAADTEAEVADLGSTLVDNIAAAMDANSLLVNWTSARAAIITDLAGISQIGDKVVADMDANSALVTILADTGAMDTEAEWANLGSTLVDNIVAAMDANSTLVTVLADTAAQDTEAEWADLGSTLVDNIVAAMDANSTLATVLADTGAMDTEAEWANLGSTLVDNIVSAFDANATSAAIIADLAGISQVGDKVVADMDANSLLVNWTADRAAILTDLAGISQIGDKVVADMDANSLLVNWTAERAAILTDLAGISQIGDKVVADMDANSILADLAGISQIGDKVQVDMDANSVLYWQERTAVKVGANNASSQNLFDVAGGPILITSLVCYVTQEIDSNVATVKIIVDRDDGAADTEFTTAVSVETDVLGTIWVFSGVNPAVLTPLTPGASGTGNAQVPWFCPEGMVETVFSAVNLQGSITYYLTWKPLKAGVTVTAQ